MDFSIESIMQYANIPQKHGKAQTWFNVEAFHERYMLNALNIARNTNNSIDLTMYANLRKRYKNLIKQKKIIH